MMWSKAGGLVAAVLIGVMPLVGACSGSDDVATPGPPITTSEAATAKVPTTFCDAVADFPVPLTGKGVKAYYAQIGSLRTPAGIPDEARAGLAVYLKLGARINVARPNVEGELRRVFATRTKEEAARMSALDTWVGQECGSPLETPSAAR